MILTAEGPNGEDVPIEQDFPRHQEDLVNITPRTAIACNRLKIPVENQLPIDINKFVKVNEKLYLDENILNQQLETYENLRQEWISQVWDERNRMLTSSKKKRVKILHYALQYKTIQNP